MKIKTKLFLFGLLIIVGVAVYSLTTQDPSDWFFRGATEGFDKAGWWGE